MINATDLIDPKNLAGNQKSFMPTKVSGMQRNLSRSRLYKIQTEQIAKLVKDMLSRPQEYDGSIDAV